MRHELERVVSDLELRLKDAEMERHVIEEYTFQKFLVQDWHGCSDACNDIREIDERIDILGSIKKQLEQILQLGGREAGGVSGSNSGGVLLSLQKGEGGEAGSRGGADSSGEEGPSGGAGA